MAASWDISGSHGFAIFCTKFSLFASVFNIIFITTILFSWEQPATTVVEETISNKPSLKSAGLRKFSFASFIKKNSKVEELIGWLLNCGN